MNKVAVLKKMLVKIIIRNIILIVWCLVGEASTTAKTISPREKSNTRNAQIRKKKRGLNLEGSTTGRKKRKARRPSYSSGLQATLVATPRKSG